MAKSNTDEIVELKKSTDFRLMYVTKTVVGLEKRLDKLEKEELYQNYAKLRSRNSDLMGKVQNIQEQINQIKSELSHPPNGMSS